MDSYIQILCRLQKCKRKVPPPLLLSYEKSPFTPQGRFFSSNNFFFEPNRQSGKKLMWWKCQPFCIYLTLNLKISNNPCDLRTFTLLCTALGMRKFQDIQIIFALSTNEKLLTFFVVELFKINKTNSFYLLLCLLESKQFKLLLMSQFTIMVQCLGKILFISWYVC